MDRRCRLSFASWSRVEVRFDIFEYAVVKVIFRLLPVKFAVETAHASGLLFDVVGIQQAASLPLWHRCTPFLETIQVLLVLAILFPSILTKLFSILLLPDSIVLVALE